MKASELDYDLPPELIAQHPAARRDASRLLVYERATGAVRHRTFADLPEEAGGALVVVNDTRSCPARIRIEPPRGEVLLVERLGGDLWEGLARPTRRLRPGRSVRAGRAARASRRGPLAAAARQASRRGRRRCRRTSPSRSPTPRATRRSTRDEAGSAAAPTAGLHFTPELLAGLEVERVTLHVGLDTFRPLAVDDLDEHVLHGERYSAAPRGRGSPRRRACSRSARRRRGCSRRSRAARRSKGRTDLFITPGFEFRRVDALVTNFHLPRSTLLALVMAFAGVEETRRLYRARGRGALPLLLLRRCDADPVSDTFTVDRDRRRRARRSPAHRARRRADARVHARRDEGDGEDARPRRAARASAPRSCSATPTTSTSARART